MENQQEWKVVGKNKKFKKKPQNVTIDENKLIDTPQTVENVAVNVENDIDTGTDLLLPYKFVVWCHDVHSKDWSINGYVKLCTLSNASEFWRVFNNLDKLGFKVNNFFIMKEGTDPIWEHENNRNGGVCSFRTDIEHALQIYEDMCIRMMCGYLTDQMDDINGISLSPKNNWAIIKIWNKNKNNDLSKTLNQYILNTYKDLSIKYKSNEPEY
ncbi:translation initiation factor eIF-4E [Fadolivirus algeromassiliense]|jgi:hypothetical protein|uniref:Translation initiation factor eIF-4E n=1 Tax=Fadolivirus FV1/VV64 TaxID=3070911 RepID=A0A7D3UUB1_9VIRU|nr:translation initiation factor eIF-4E [Fadolivirus algeromassiliense]QKF94031.1 translation initiation factor eIF-4E [Fadolivirus FV1/VV64]